MLKERDSYSTLTTWLSKNYYVDSNCLWQDAQIKFGSLKARCDVVGYEFDKTGNYPTCKELSAIHLFECKLDYAITQAYGQLLFYREIVQRYMNSKHYEAFNKDFYDGIKKYYQKHDRYPRGYKSTFWLKNKILIYIHLAVMETGSADDEFYKFVEGSLGDSFLDGKVGLVVLTRQNRKWKVKERKKAKAIIIERKPGPKPYYQMEPPVADIFRKTRISCRRFKDGNRNSQMCAENAIDPAKCTSCDFNLPI